MVLTGKCSYLSYEGKMDRIGLKHDHSPAVQKTEDSERESFTTDVSNEEREDE